jgi:hypothetical protein
LLVSSVANAMVGMLILVVDVDEGAVAAVNVEADAKAISNTKQETQLMIGKVELRFLAMRRWKESTIVTYVVDHLQEMRDMKLATIDPIHPQRSYIFRRDSSIDRYRFSTRYERWGVKQATIDDTIPSARIFLGVLVLVIFSISLLATNAGD